MILSFILFIPIVGFLFLILLPKERKAIFRYAILFFQLLALGCGLYLAFLFDTQKVGYQFVEKLDWISFLGISYHLGIDGISLVMCLLVLLIFPIVCWGGWNSYLSEDAKISQDKWLCIQLLILQAGLLGVFLAVDIFLFYIFWELVLIPTYFIIVLWGGEHRVKSALQFFIFTMGASFLMLLAILVLGILYFQQTGEFSFDMNLWQNLNLGNWEGIFFWAFAIAFAVKIPLFPFHFWMPAAYKNAPWMGTIFMSALLSKMGIYGFFRLAIPLFPSAAQDYTTIFLVFAVMSILYAASIAMIQKDLKMVIAYSSMSHLGLILVGVFSFHSLAWNGAILQIINHSLITTSLFLVLSFLYTHFKTVQVGSFFGLARIIPKFCFVFFIFTLASIGFPSTNGFVGEFTILVGSFQTVASFAVFAALGLILSAAYMLRINQKIFFGAIPENSFRTKKDLSLIEFCILLPSLIAIFWIGIYPKFFFQWFEVYVKQILILF